MPRSCTWLALSLVLIVACICRSESPAKPERIVISGKVVDDQSRGVAGAKVRGIAYTDNPEATTDDEGRFALDVLEERVRQLSIIADDGERVGVYTAEWANPPNAETPIEISLAPCRRLPVEVVDANGEPAQGTTVGAAINYAALVSAITDAAGKAELRLPRDSQVQELYAVKQGTGFDYRVVSTRRDDAYRADWFQKPPVRFQLADSQTVQIRLVDADEKPIVGTEVYLWLLNKPGEPDSFNLGNTPTLYRVATDETGIAEFRGVPKWDVHPLLFWPVTEEYVRIRISYDPKELPEGPFTVKLDRLVPVSGHVRFADGRPAADIAVSAVGAGFTFDGFNEKAKTDKKGEFELWVAPHRLYLFVARNEQWASPALDGIVVRPDEPVEGLKFELRPATRVFGQVTVGSDKKPVSGQRMSMRLEGERAELTNPENDRLMVRPSISRSVVTDDEGRFEFFVGPGKYTLSGPSQVKAEKFEIGDESELEFNIAAPRPETGPFAGMVVTGDPPRPVAGAIVSGIYRNMSAGRDLRLLADQKGRFEGERALHGVVLFAKSGDGELAGILEIGPDDSEATISIDKLASAKARLIDAETGNPLPETKVQWGRRVHLGDDDAPWRTAFGGSATTDPDGRFEVTGLVVGGKYEFSVPRGDGTYGGLPSFTPETANTTDLGDLRLKPPYKPPTFEERVDRELAVRRPAGERYMKALEEAERLRQNVLVVFLDRDSPVSENWFKLRLDDRQVRSALPDFQLVQLDVESKGAATLAERLGITIEAEKLPIWRFGDASDNELETGSVPRLKEEEGIDRAAVLNRLALHAPEPLDARQLLNDALAEAATGNRRVIVQETATWCGPCHRLAHYLESNRSIWEKDYIWVRIDERWKGSEEVMNDIKEGNRGGIPWCAILDSEGKVLATSDGPDGNIGFPSEPEGIEHFMTMLESTKQRMSEGELAELREDLESR